MTRTRLLLAVLVAALAGGVLAAPAAALVDLSAVAAGDVAVEEGTPIRDEARGRLEDAARELRAAGTPVKFVVLARRPDDPFAYARSLRAGLRFDGDVLVLSADPRNLAIASPLSSSTLNRVYDGRLDELRREPVAGTIAVARDLAGLRSGAGAAAGAPAPAARGDGDGGSAGAVLLVMLLIGGGAVLVATVAGRRRRRAAAEREVTAGAAALEPLVDALAAQISDLEEDMAVGGARATDAAPHHEAAVLAYGEARDAMAAPPTPAGVRTAGAALERGLHAAHRARAALEGRPPDEADAEPLLEGMCAFDPKHGRATDTVVISTPDGDTAELPACARCAAQMARGEQPRFREVEEDGRLVPYWQSRGMAGGFGYGFGVPVLGGALAGLMLGGLLGAGTADAAGFDDPGVGGGDFGDFGGGGGFGGGDFGGGGFGGGDF